MSLTLTGIVYKRIYGYFGVYLDAVWNPVEDDIPLVKNEIERIIEGGEKI